jgi:hypothetical protein
MKFCGRVYAFNSGSSIRTAIAKPSALGKDQSLASLPKPFFREDDDQAIQIIHIATKALEARRMPQVQRQRV